MKCDDVFDALLSGSPAAPELQSHLRSCGRCRDLADVLSPMLPRTDETPRRADLVSVTTSPRQPSPAAVQVAQAAAARLHSVSPDPAARLRRRSPTFVGHCAAFLAGAAASLVLAACLSLPSAAIAPRAAQPICRFGRELIEKSNWQVAASGCQKCHTDREQVEAPSELPSADVFQLEDEWRDLLATADSTRCDPHV